MNKPTLDQLRARIAENTGNFKGAGGRKRLLSTEQEEQVVSLYATGECGTLRALAARFNVGVSTVWRVIQRRLREQE